MDVLAAPRAEIVPEKTAVLDAWWQARLDGTMGQRHRCVAATMPMQIPVLPLHESLTSALGSLMQHGIMSRGTRR